MTNLPDNGPLPGIARNARPVASTKAGATTEAAGTDTGGPAFRILLEQLQEKAAALQASSGDVNDSADLRGAVDNARATLADALSLGDQVLEAFRGAQRTGLTGAEEAPPHEGEHTTRTEGPRTTDKQDE